MKDNGFVPSAKVKDSDVVASQILERVRAGRAKIPVWPEAAEEALRIARSPTADLRDIARVIATDTGLYARILAVVNSPLYSRGTEIKDLGVALVRLGLETTKTLLMQSIVMSGIFRSKKFGSEVKAHLFHALHHAYLGRELASRFGLNRDTLFTFLLLHDIGVVASYKLMEDLRYPISGEDAGRAAHVHHAEVGALLLEQNHVPPEITGLIRVHAEAEPEGEARPYVEALRAVAGLLSTYPSYPAELRNLFDDPVRDAAIANAMMRPDDLRTVYEETLPKVLEGVDVLVSQMSRR